jgi:hypothetical protein
MNAYVALLMATQVGSSPRRLFLVAPLGIVVHCVEAMNNPCFEPTVKTNRPDIQ